MAATEPDVTGSGRRLLTRRALLGYFPRAASLLVLPVALRADRSEDLMAVISYIATALTAGNASDAMLPFDASLPGRDKLSGYFDALCTEVTVRSDVEMIEEKGTDTESDALLRWTLDLRGRMNNDELERRVRQVHVRFVPAPSHAKYGLWKIVSFDDIELFNPFIQQAK